MLSGIWIHFRVGIFLLVLLVLLTSCSRKKPLVGQAGLESTAAGIRLIATYDSRFDRIIDNYQLLTVTFVNQSPNVIQFNHEKDVWTVTTRSGKKVQAINNLRFVNERVWNRLPTRAQEVIEYPRVILRNTTLTFDLIFPQGVELAGFTRVDFFSHHLDKGFVGGSTYGEVL